MEHLLEENVALEDLKKFEARYQAELSAGQASASAQFDYAWCLVRSKYPSDIRKGILLLEDLYTVRFTYLTYVWSSGWHRKNLGPKVGSSHVSTTYTESEKPKIKIF